MIVLHTGLRMGHHTIDISKTVVVAVVVVVVVVAAAVVLVFLSNTNDRK